MILQACITVVSHIIRPRRSRSAAAYGNQTFPQTICRSVRRSVQCIVEKTADRIRMPFGIIGRTSPGMRQVVGIGLRERVLLGANLERAIVTNGDFTAQGLRVRQYHDAGVFPNYFGQTCLLQAYISLISESRQLDFCKTLLHGHLIYTVPPQ